VDTGGAVTIDRSTIEHNVAVWPPPSDLCNSYCDWRDPDGNAIAATEVHISRSTIAANGVSAPTDPYQGGKATIAATTAVTIDNSTVSDNTSYVAAITATTVHLDATTVADNQDPVPIKATTLDLFATAITAGTVDPGGLCAQVKTVASRGWNVLQATDCTGLDATDLATTASLGLLPLGPIAPSGLDVRVPGPTSPLLDRIPPASCPAGPDENGTPRPTAAPCDVGAVETDAP
jgi:hypothetical protein